MKRMNNYEAPKAEVLELAVNKSFMLGGGTEGFGETSEMNP